jgi:hypothetical protein
MCLGFVLGGQLARWLLYQTLGPKPLGYRLAEDQTLLYCER